MDAQCLRMRAAAITNRGIVAEANEDCIAVAGWIRNTCMVSPIVFECMLDEPRLCLVADGLGGQAGGEVASSVVAQSIGQAAMVCPDEASIAVLLSRVNKQLYEAMSTRPDLCGMGSTIVGFVTVDSNAIVFNCGDSRAYRDAGNYLRLLSVDDTSSCGRLDTAAKTGSHGHAITQCLGGAANFSEVHPHIMTVPLYSGARILLCSDGLTDMLDQDQIERHVSRNAQVSVTKLYEAAIAAGGADNISIIIADFETVGSMEAEEAQYLLDEILIGEDSDGH